MFLADQLVQPLSPDLFWILCVALGIAFLLAFSVGANDVSNSFGTSVGSRVLTVTQACILATICEMAGACLLGYSVCDTFRRKMYDVSLFKETAQEQKELMLGALACLIGSALWNIIATALKMPISGTHSIVGATIGFSLVSRGLDSIRWTDMLRIVASWFVSPLLSGLISSLIYAVISKTIIRKIDPLRHGLKALPLFYGVTIFINVASVVIDGPAVLGLNTLAWYEGLFIALVCALIAICCVALLLAPKLRREIMDELMAQRKFSRTPLPLPITKSAAGGRGVPARIPLSYDNQTFKPDGSESQEAAKEKRRTPRKPSRGQRLAVSLDEVALDPKKLQTEAASTEPKQIGATGDTKPPVAPKPAHLKRQAAQEASLDDEKKEGEKFDEIDLSPAKAADRPCKASEPTAVVDVERGELDPKAPGSQVALISACGERYEIARLFASLQILTACFASFAHGTNDVSNAVAPLIPIWNIYSTGAERVAIPSQVWILAFGSIGICSGLWAWGRAVMGTISDGLTKITPSMGFSVELGAAVSVLLATKLGMPISTTHCKVGSLVIVGFVSKSFLSQDRLLDQAAVAEQQGQPAQRVGTSLQQLQILDEKEATKEDSVDWLMFRNIALTWILTVPLAAVASALVMLALKALVL